MWKAEYPEFSWLTKQPGETTDLLADKELVNQSRCYQMFAPDISRVGYGDPGVDGKCPIWSIMCPQQGIWIPELECTLNIEITVLSSGGWVTEHPMSMDAQLTIQPKIWFSPYSIAPPPPYPKGLTAPNVPLDWEKALLMNILWQLFERVNVPFPLSKDKAIRLHAYGVNQQDQPVPSAVINVQDGMDPNYQVPSFARHDHSTPSEPKAAACVYLGVEIGDIIPAVGTNGDIADWFNQIVLDIFNVVSGNLLRPGSVLSWNIWASEPEPVQLQEWEEHAAYWRWSIDVDHASPGYPCPIPPRYYDGKPFKYTEDLSVHVQKLRNGLGEQLAKAGATQLSEAELRLFQQQIASVAEYKLDHILSRQAQRAEKARPQHASPEA